MSPNRTEDVPLVEFMYLVFTRMPGGVTVGDSSLDCCVPCLLSAIASLCRVFKETFAVTDSKELEPIIRLIHCRIVFKEGTGDNRLLELGPIVRLVYRRGSSPASTGDNWIPRNWADCQTCISPVSYTHLTLPTS